MEAMEVQKAAQEARVFAGARLMEQIGGSFARQIAGAYFVADSGNKAKLLAAFGELFERYAVMADAA